MANADRLANNPKILKSELEQLHESAYHWALKHCAYDSQQAMDLMQEVYMKIMTGKAYYRGESALKTWLLSVIRISALESRRRFASRLRHLKAFFFQVNIDHSMPDAQAQVEGKQKHAKVLTALTKLSHKQQEVVELVFYQDLTIEQAAQVMGISVGSARVHYSRAKQSLEKYLKQEQTDE